VAAVTTPITLATVRAFGMAAEASEDRYRPPNE
jgi:hypothetical protein